jgi:UDP-N-acetylglucosamine 2-epimerase (non-hydrolysing)
MHRVLIIVGTRPEAIKMGPVVQALRADDSFRAVTLATAQHRDLLDEVLELFEIEPDHDLNVMTANQQLADVTAKCVTGIDRILKEETPSIALAQGDTTTVMAAALSCYYNRIPFGHVEAGLRTENKFSPYPEEINRRLTGSLADLHFAPTVRARENLLRENIDPASIHVSGNTVVDAVQKIAEHPAAAHSLGKDTRTFLDSVKRPILVTAHRRESFGAPLEDICMALREITEAHPDVGLVFPVHPNPNVRRTVDGLLQGRERILLTEPVNYIQFVQLMKEAHLILSDSGGVQEEAPSLKKPVLVLRENTERPEGVEAGIARLVGTDRRRIVEEANRLLGSREEYARMIASTNPYGDGTASRQIVNILRDFLGGSA